MIITDDFVLLNFPRTGSTFLRDALKRLYAGEGEGRRSLVRHCLGWTKPRMRELILPIDRTFSALARKRRSQHGTYAQIPTRYRKLPVISVMRNPYDLYVSHYEFGFWRNNLPSGRRVPWGPAADNPDLSFEEYIEMMYGPGLDDVLMGRERRADVGHLTVHFLKFFSREPERVIDALTDEYIDDQLFRDDLAPIRFLHLESLVEELRRFLEEMGHSMNRTTFLRDLPRQNEAHQRQGRHWSEYLTGGLRERIRRKERLLFLLFPEYDA